MQLLEPLSLVPYLNVLGPLALHCKAAKSYGLLVEPDSLFLPHFLLEGGQSLDV